MQFTAREDIELPAERLFALLADTEAHERMALRRGIEVTRLKPETAEGRHPAWDVTFHFRGRDRHARIFLAEQDPPHRLVFASRAPGLETETRLDLLPLSQRRTRLGVEFELRPQSLQARLLVQSLKLGAGNLNKRFRLRVADLARELETRGARRA